MIPARALGAVTSGDNMGDGMKVSLWCKRLCLSFYLSKDEVMLISRTVGSKADLFDERRRSLPRRDLKTQGTRSRDDPWCMDER